MGARCARPDAGTGLTPTSPQERRREGLSLTDLVRAALAEDLGDRGDVTSQLFIPRDLIATASLVSRQLGVFAGHAAGDEVLRQCGVAATWLLGDGDALTPGALVAEIHGPARAVLVAERTLLNFVCHLSGIASMTRQFVDACAPALVLDTRKTTPGLRLLEKAAVAAGGGTNHRIGLFDRVLVKDNHLALAGAGLEDAVAQARVRFPDLVVEVEADDLDGVRRAAACGVDWILLDNMEPADLRAAVALVGGHVKLEASGRMNLERAREAAACGVDAISIGSLTHSAPTLDLGLDISA